MIVYLLFPYLSFIKCKSSSTGGAAKKVWRRTASSQAVFSFRASRQWSLHHIILLKLMQRTGLLMPNLQKHPEDYNELYSGMFFFLLLFYPAFIVAFYCIRSCFYDAVVHASQTVDCLSDCKKWENDCVFVPSPLSGRQNAVRVGLCSLHVIVLTE